MKPTGKVILIWAMVFGMSSVCLSEESKSRRRIAAGQTMPEVSVVDSTGKAFVYKESSGKVLMLVFLSAGQQRSRDVVKDVFGVLSDVSEKKLGSLQVAFVMQNGDDKSFGNTIVKEAPCPVHVLYDEDHHIWGQFGIIAMPTVLISNSQGKVLCVKPGLAYDEAPVVRSRLFQALGIPTEISPEEASIVRTVSNSTVSAKAKRHLNTAKLLLKRGRIEAATKQARLAREMDPNSREVALELAELLYRARRTKQTLEVIELVGEVSGRTPKDQANINLLLGWAHRELGNLDKAKTLLQAGLEQDPKSHRLFFELGRLHQKQNNTERAMEAYFRALQLIYEEGKL